MFEQFMPNSDASIIRQQTAAEEKQMQFGREQLAMQAAAEQYGEQDGGKSDLIRWQQELDNELETIKYTLKNYKRTGDKWEQNFKIVDGEKVMAPQLLTDEGIQAIEAEIRPFMSKNIINSNLNENRIVDTLKFTCKTITRIMGYNYDTYVVEPTPQNMSHIRRIVKNSMIPGIFRSINGWTKRQDNMVSKRVETFNDNPNQMNGNKWGGLFGK